MEYLGVVQVPLSNLYFLQGNGERAYYPTQSEQLESIFKGTAIDHSNHMHWIDGYIDRSETRIAFGSLGFSQSQLRQQNESGIYPPLMQQVVGYTQGQHRIDAAKRVDQSSNWTVRLFQVDLAALPFNPTVRRRTEQCQHEKPDTDGHIYCKLRKYRNEKFDYNEWHGRLSRSKQEAFFSINQRAAVAAALDRLTCFPAIIDDLFLTNFLKYFNLRLDDECVAGLDDVYVTWSNFIGSNQALQRHIDRDTVTALEGRAPEVSHADRQWICAAFESREVFRGIDDPELRRVIQQRVQAAQGIIPTLRSLQSNLTFVGIAAEIIWNCIVPKKLRKQARSQKRPLRRALRNFWVATGPYIETGEGDFATACGQPNFETAYTQLFLAALRQFPYLSNWRPKVEKGERLIFGIDTACISLFCRRAKLLGFRTFRTNALDEYLSTKTAFLPPAREESSGLGEIEALGRLDRRWGRPSTSLFQVMQKSAFLPAIRDECHASGLNMLYILRHLLRIFFVVPAFEVDHSSPLVQLSRHAKPPACSCAPAARGCYNVANRGHLRPITEFVEDTEACDTSSSSVDSISESAGTGGSLVTVHGGGAMSPRECDREQGQEQPLLVQGRQEIARQNIMKEQIPGVGPSTQTIHAVQHSYLSNPGIKERLELSCRTVSAGTALAPSSESPDASPQEVLPSRVTQDAHDFPTQPLEVRDGALPPNFSRSTHQQGSTRPKLGCRRRRSDSYIDDTSEAPKRRKSTQSSTHSRSTLFAPERHPSTETSSPSSAIDEQRAALGDLNYSAGLKTVPTSLTPPFDGLSLSPARSTEYCPNFAQDAMGLDRCHGTLLPEDSRQSLDFGDDMRSPQPHCTSHNPQYDAERNYMGRQRQLYGLEKRRASASSVYSDSGGLCLRSFESLSSTPRSSASMYQCSHTRPGSTALRQPTYFSGESPTARSTPALSESASLCLSRQQSNVDLFISGIHERLQQLPRGAGERLSMWPGFDDSDDDVTSICLTD